MTLRPQFSLRTLLLVTAMIAVGAKLWHGPYHVIETIDGVEHEYDYYRGFGWERLIDGPYISRGIADVRYHHKNINISYLSFYRKGQRTTRGIEVVAHSDENVVHTYFSLQHYVGPTRVGDRLNMLITTAEDLNFQNSVEQEINRYKQQGLYVKQSFATGSSLEEHKVLFSPILHSQNQ